MILEDNSYLFVVMEIGCLECNVPSSLIGIYQHANEAMRACKDCETRMSWRYGGDNSFEVFKIKVKDMNVNLVDRYQKSVSPCNCINSASDFDTRDGSESSSSNEEREETTSGGCWSAT